jgi:hypothetical protein
LLLLASDLSDGILCVTDGTLYSTLGLIGLPFGLGLGIAQSLASLFFQLSGSPSPPLLRYDPCPLAIPGRTDNKVILALVPSSGAGKDLWSNADENAPEVRGRFDFPGCG